MKVGVFTPAYNEGNRGVLIAFAAGIPGAELHDDRAYEPCDVMVIFGLVKKVYQPSHAKGELIRRHRGPVVVVERGFVGRGPALPGPDIYAGGTYWSVGLGGINGRADFRNDGSPADRWARLGVEMKPWRLQGGDGALIVGQVPWDVSVQDSDHIGWVKAQVNDARRHGLAVRFRPHPYAVKRGVNYGVDCEVSRVGLDEDLARASLVVTQNSNVGVDAAIAGVPVVATDQGSMAWPVAAHSITEAVADDHWWPCRLQWAYDLAYAQWTIEEMRDGSTWRHLAL